MNKTTTEKYRDFILENFIGDSIRVQLPKIDEEGRAWNVKIGLSVYIKVICIYCIVYRFVSAFVIGGTICFFLDKMPSA